MATQQTCPTCKSADKAERAKRETIVPGGTLVERCQDPWHITVEPDDSYVGVS